MKVTTEEAAPVSAGESREAARIADQLIRAFEGEAWHGPSIEELLADVDASTAAERPIAEAHTIWEIVNHLAAWEQAALLGLRDEMPTLAEAEDWPPVLETDEEAWDRTKRQLRLRAKALREAAARLSDEEVARKVPGRDYTTYFLLHGLVQHSLYHGGQIALLKRAAGVGTRR